MSIQTEPVGSLRDVTEVRLGLAVGGLFGTAAVLVTLAVPTVMAVTSLLVQTGVTCLAVRRRAAALFVGLVGWGLGTGFAVNRLGVLTFSAPDLGRMALFAVAAQVGLAAHDTMASVGAARRRRDGWGHAQRPATGMGIRRRRPGTLAGRAGPRSAP